jgi:RNA polymerase sigma factor (sigma-70 family)
MRSCSRGSATTTLKRSSSLCANTGLSSSTTSADSPPRKMRPRTLRSGRSVSCGTVERTGEQRGSMRALICRIARNYAVSEHRRQCADERSAATFAELSATASTARDSIETEQLRTAIERQIALLPERRREIFVLRCVHDLSYKEIADVMNIAPQTVANQLSTALATLRDSLRGMLD